jgi:hypothetical protein
MSSEFQSQLSSLLKSPELAALGPGPRDKVLTVAEVDAAVSEVTPQSRELVRALVLLWHDHLNEAHEIAQDIKSADGSFIHAIMHRREPDFWNSKYWWRNVGNHPAFEEIGIRAGRLLKERGAGDLAKKLVPGGRWDACAFVDACQKAGQENELLLREVQKIETEVLLEQFLESSNL